MCNMNVHVNVIKRKTARSTRMGQIGKCVRRNYHKWNRFCSACCSSGFLRKKISVRMLLDHPVERAMHQTLPAQNVEPNKQRDPIFGWDLWVVMRISMRMIKTHSWTDQPTIPEVVSGKNDHKWNGRTFFLGRKIIRKIAIPFIIGFEKRLHRNPPICEWLDQPWFPTRRAFAEKISVRCMRFFNSSKMF